MIGLIVISYGRPELIAPLIESLSRTNDAARVHLLVVDNGSTEVTKAALSPLVVSSAARRLAGFEILFEETNWGYFGGAQKGLGAFQQMQSSLWPRLDWVIVSNSDIAFPQLDFFSRLVQSPTRLDRTGRLAVVAPSVCSGLSGGDQNPFMVERPTVRRMQTYRQIFAHYWSGALYKFMGLLRDRLRLRARSKPGAGTQKIYAPHGSFICFHRRYFEAGLDFEHGAFLFNEEVTVAERCRSKELEVWYDPSLVVAHAEHATMGGWPSRKVMAFHRDASRWTAETFFGS